MKVHELITKLAGFDANTEVLVSRDEEGNGFNALEDVELSGAYPDGYGWEVVHPDDEDEYQDEEGFTKVVVLWP